MIGGCDRCAIAARTGSMGRFRPRSGSRTRPNGRRCCSRGISRYCTILEWVFAATQTARIADGGADQQSRRGIFGHLPVAQFEPPFEEFFATPQEVDFAKLVAAYGVEHVVVRDWAHLAVKAGRRAARGRDSCAGGADGSQRRCRETEAMVCRVGRGVGVTGFSGRLPYNWMGRPTSMICMGGRL